MKLPQLIIYIETIIFNKFSEMWRYYLICTIGTILHQFQEQKSEHWVKPG